MTETTKARYLLKILAGPHQGAEVALDNEELLIGSALECDFILSDALVSPEHLKIVLADDRITLVPLSAAVFVDGQEIPMESMDIEPFQFVTIGSTSFVIGPIEGEWPQLSSADVPELKKLEKSEHTEGQEGEREGERAEGSDKKTNKKAEDKPIEPKVSTQAMGLGVAALLLLVGFIFVGAYMLLGSSATDRPSPIDYSKRVGLILDRLGLEDTFEVTNPSSGIVRVEGWVDTDKERDEILDQFKNIRSRIDLRIWSQQQVVAQTKEYFQTVRLPLDVESVSPGVVRVMGYHGDKADWRRFKDGLQQESPGIKSIVDEVMTSSEVQALSKEIFKEFDLSDKVYLEAQPHYLAAKGMITEEEIPKLSEAVKKIQDEVGFPVPIQNQIQVATVEQVYLDAQIDSVVVGGGQGVIITKDGQRLFEGGVLSGGYIIVKISRDGVTLKKGDQEITLKIGDSNEQG